MKKEFEKLEQLIIMRLSPNEGYSSKEMDEMIQNQVNKIIVTYQEEP